MFILTTLTCTKWFHYLDITFPGCLTPLFSIKQITCSLLIQLDIPSSTFCVLYRCMSHIFLLLMHNRAWTSVAETENFTFQSLLDAFQHHTEASYSDMQGRYYIGSFDTSVKILTHPGSLNVSVLGNWTSRYSVILGQLGHYPTLDTWGVNNACMDVGDVVLQRVLKTPHGG